MPRASVGAERLPEAVNSQGGRPPRDLALGGASRYVGKAATCRAPGFPVAGEPRKEMTQTEPCQCDSMTGARPGPAPEDSLARQSQLNSRATLGPLPSRSPDAGER